MRPATECPPPNSRATSPGSPCSRLALCPRLLPAGRRAETEPEPILLGQATAPGGGYPTGDGRLLAEAKPKRRPLGACRGRPGRLAGGEGPIEVVLDPPSNAPFVAPKPRPAARLPSRPRPSTLCWRRRRRELASIKTYQVRLTRQERIGESLQPPEDVVLSIRRSPKAVRLEWPDGPHQGPRGPVRRRAA